MRGKWMLPPDVPITLMEESMNGQSGPVSFTGRKAPARRPSPLVSSIVAVTTLGVTLSVFVAAIILVVLAASALVAGVDWAWNLF